MRRDLYTLASLAALTLVAGTASAQTTTRRGVEYFSRSGNRATQTAQVREQPTEIPSRFVRDRPADPAERTVPGIKNYHRELFGDRTNANTRTAETSRTAANTRPDPRTAATTRPTVPTNTRPTVPTANVRPAAGPSLRPSVPTTNPTVESRPRPTGNVRQVGFRDFDPAATRDATVGDAPIGGPEDKGVVTAGFDENQWGGGIQQVADEVEQPAGPSNLTITPAVGGPAAAAVGPQSPSLTLEWVKQTDVNVGQECVLDLHVKNAGEITAYDVVIEAYFPKTLRMLSTEPKAAENRDSLSWSFPRVNTDETKTIRVKFIPTQRGDLATRANVRFTGAAATLFKVEEPLLQVAISGPSQVHLGEPASQIVTVSNPGTGIARNVVLEARLPEGLEHPKSSKLVTEIGALNPGEKRQVRLALSATGGGNQIVLVSAVAEGNLKQAAQAAVNVVAPSLNVGIRGPKLRYLGRPADYEIAVVNDGSAPTDNVRVVHVVPEGFDFVSASRGGKYSTTSRQISWFVGRIDKGQALRLACRLEPKSTGTAEHRVGAISEQGARAEATLPTRVESAAELILEIVDLDDPVEVGVETAYEIRVRNEGSKAASDVGVSCELPSAVEFVSGRGPTQHVAEGGVVVFKSIPSLAPGKTALFRVIVKGNSEGNHRFRARLASESITEPLIIEELTKFYGE